MGGRIATQVAAADPALPVAGLVLLGYPLHPPGKPDQRRDKHLPAIHRPMLFVQGTRDAFGTPDELAPILETLQPPPQLYAIAQGDHSFKLSRKDPAAQAQVLRTICSARSSVSYLQLHDVAAVREAVREVQRHAPLGRPQDDAVDLVGAAPGEHRLQQPRAGPTARRGFDVQVRDVGEFLQLRERIRNLRRPCAPRSDRRSPRRRRPPRLSRCCRAAARAASRRCSAGRMHRASRLGVSRAARNSQRSSASAFASAIVAGRTLIMNRSSRRNADAASTTASDHSCPPSNASGVTATPASREPLRRRVRKSSCVYHSSRAPWQTSARPTRRNDAASISGGTSPPTAMTPAIARAEATAARNVIATPCENPQNTTRGAPGNSRSICAITAAT